MYKAKYIKYKKKYLRLKKDIYLHGGGDIKCKYNNGLVCNNNRCSQTKYKHINETNYDIYSGKINSLKKHDSLLNDNSEIYRCDTDIFMETLSPSDLPKKNKGLANIGQTCFMNSTLQLINSMELFKKSLIEKKFHDTSDLIMVLNHMDKNPEIEGIKKKLKACHMNPSHLGEQDDAFYQFIYFMKKLSGETNPLKSIKISLNSNRTGILQKFDKKIIKDSPLLHLLCTTSNYKSYTLSDNINNTLGIILNDINTKIDDSSIDKNSISEYKKININKNNLLDKNVYNIIVMLKNQSANTNIHDSILKLYGICKIYHDKSIEYRCAITLYFPHTSEEKIDIPKMIDYTTKTYEENVSMEITNNNYEYIYKRSGFDILTLSNYVIFKLDVDHQIDPNYEITKKTYNSNIIINEEIILKQETNNSNSRYELLSVVVHWGGTSDGGHYIAYVKNNTGYMMYSDDSTPQSKTYVEMSNTFSFNSTPIIICYKFKDYV